MRGSLGYPGWADLPGDASVAVPAVWDVRGMLRIGAWWLDAGDLNVGVDSGEAGEVRLVASQDHATSSLDGRSHNVSVGQV
jgi:hypothetical protein